jgi:putative solute:sodium symporter small subunit
MSGADAARARWRSSQRITLLLLVVWGAVTFGVAYFARDLDGRVFGWPFSFWVAAQGALLVYLALVCVYAWLARRVDDADAIPNSTPH